jgi:hypothetical protein
LCLVVFIDVFYCGCWLDCRQMKGFLAAPALWTTFPTAGNCTGIFTKGRPACNKVCYTFTFTFCAFKERKNWPWWPGSLYKRSSSKLPLLYILLVSRQCMQHHATAA